MRERGASAYSTPNRRTHSSKSAYPLEVLATVAWIHHENPAFGVAEIIDEARKWPARKEYLLQPEHVTMALQRIKKMKTVE